MSFSHCAQVGPGRHIILNITMAKHACSSFTIENDNGSEVCSPVSEKSAILLYVTLPMGCICIVQAQVEVFLNQTNR